MARIFCIIENILLDLLTAFRNREVEYTGGKFNEVS